MTIMCTRKCILPLSFLPENNFGLETTAITVKGDDWSYCSLNQVLDLWTTNYLRAPKFKLVWNQYLCLNIDLVKGYGCMSF